MHMIAVNAFDYIQAPTPHCWPHLPQRPASGRWSCLCPLSPQLLMLSARHTWHLIFPQENKDELADHMWILACGFWQESFLTAAQLQLASLAFPSDSSWQTGEVSTVSHGRCFLLSHSFVTIHQPQRRPAFALVSCVAFGVVWFGEGTMWGGNDCYYLW